MAEEVVMEPVAGEEPPKTVNPLGVAKPPAPPKATATATLKPGLKLPPKPGATVSSLRPGLKLPPKPGATVSALRPGLKLPPKPGATVSGLKPGVRLPSRPVIRKPGATVGATPLPKPIAPVAPAAPAAPVEAAAPAAPAAPAAAPAAPAATPAATVEAKPIAQNIAEVASKTVPIPDIPPMPETPKPVEQLKAVTAKLKGVTQQIPQQAILRKTGIIADEAMSDAQREAQKSKTARISLSDAIGVSPVKNENAPMKTIRIKRPIDIPTATKPMTPPARPATATVEATPVTAPKPAETPTEAAKTEAPAPTTTASSPSITQRKTLKISRPGVVRPGGKFGVKRPTQASTVISKASAPADGAAEGENPVADIADIPEMPTSTPFAATPDKVVETDEGPAWLWSLSSLVQAAACLAMGLLAWYLYTNTQTLYF